MRTESFADKYNLIAVTLVAGVSFIDDIQSLSGRRMYLRHRNKRVIWLEY